MRSGVGNTVDSSKYDMYRSKVDEVVRPLLPFSDRELSVISVNCFSDEQKFNQLTSTLSLTPRVSSPRLFNSISMSFFEEDDALSIPINCSWIDVSTWIAE